MGVSIAVRKRILLVSDQKAGFYYVRFRGVFTFLAGYGLTDPVACIIISFLAHFGSSTNRAGSCGLLWGKWGLFTLWPFDSVGSTSVRLMDPSHRWRERLILKRFAPFLLRVSGNPSAVLKGRFRDWCHRWILLGLLGGGGTYIVQGKRRGDKMGNRGDPFARIKNSGGNVPF